MSAPLLSSQSTINGFINIPDDEVLPSESASQPAPPESASQLSELSARSTISETRSIQATPSAKVTHGQHRSLSGYGRTLRL
ncbi:hypothetical protein V1515DRAFT_610764 [Lipomyces mesembrius]